MRTIDEITEFIVSAIKHGNATELGDSKTANKQYKIINAAATSLLADIESFGKLLEHENPYVRLWSASYLIKVDTTKNKAIVELEKLKTEKGFLGFDASMILKTAL